MDRPRPCACEYQDHRLDNGNCPNKRGPDGLPLQCVGIWAKDKHSYLGRYIAATKGVRAHYLPPQGIGGAAYIDLFAGPGQALVRETGEIIDGSPLIALGHSDAPFSRLVYCDIAKDNTTALLARTSYGVDRVRILVGDCNVMCDEILRHVPPSGLNIALVDPFAPSGLRWRTLERLGSIERMDFIIHFPTGPIKRNFSTPGFDKTIDEILGFTSWRTAVKSSRDVAKLIGIMQDRLATIGYAREQVRSFPIRNSQGVVMYHLMFAAKHPLGNKIWDSIGRNEPGGQISLPL